MPLKKQSIVIGIAGMPGAGKDTVKEIICRYGFPVIVMGDEIRAEAARRNLTPTPENLGRLMVEIRAEEGPDAVAKRCIRKIRDLDADVIVVNGLRNPEEVELFRREFPSFRVIAIHASPRTRFKRLLKRGRSDDPKDWATFCSRDRRELSVGLGNVIAMADYMIVNEGEIEELEREVKMVIEKVVVNERPDRKC
ncbi:MAG: AAA family ATPase [Candidatus Bathyarchaeia archaeon]